MVLNHGEGKKLRVRKLVCNFFYNLIKMFALFFDTMTIHKTPQNAYRIICFYYLYAEKKNKTKNNYI